MKQANCLNKFICNKILLTISGIFILLSAIALYFNGPDFILTSIISNLFILTQGYQIYDQWMYPENPIPFNLYAYNISNLDAFLAGREKAHLNKIGPYTYDLHISRNVTNITDTTLTFTNRKDFFFNKALSGHLDPKKDFITYPNMPALELITQGAIINRFAQLISNDAESLFKTTSVHDFLWGHNVDLLKMVNNFDKSQPEMYGMMFDQNGTVSEAGTFEYTVWNGKGRTQDLLTIKSINQETTISCWDKPMPIRGTDLEQVSPLVHKYDTKNMTVWNEAAYRPMELFYDSDHKHLYKKGLPIPVKRYKQTRDSYNGDYCSNGYCVFKDTGVVDISGCRSLQDVCF